MVKENLEIMHVNGFNIPGRFLDRKVETPMDNKRAHSSEFKAKVVLEFIRNRKNTDQICSEHGITESILNRWTQEFLENAHLAFAGSMSEDQKSNRIAELGQLVNQLSRDLETCSRALKFMSRAFSVRKEVKSSNIPDIDVAESSDN
jgi:transposase-like protein